MKITPLGIEGAWLAEFEVWPDARGYFREWFRYDEILKETKIDFSVKQTNFSMSHKGVIRVIHYSLAPEGQSKWVTCVSGEIIDVVVDLRPDSPTFKKIEYIHLTPENGKAVLIKSGLGHAFISQSDNSGMSYLLSSKYTPSYELSLNPFDVELSIKWDNYSDKALGFTCSTSDRNAPTLAQSLNKGLLPTR